MDGRSPYPAPPYGFGNAYHPPPAPVPAPMPMHPFQAPIPAMSPMPSPAPQPVDYPFVLTGKRVMTLLSPDGTRPLLAVKYESSTTAALKGLPSLTVHRGGPDGPIIGDATTHSFTTDKVDVNIGPQKYHFKKKLDSLTGLGSLVWSVDNGELYLEGGKDGPLMARFAPRESGVGSTKRLEGRFEIRRPGLSDVQFEEIFITGVAEMERRRSNAEDEKAAISAIGAM